MLKIYYTLGNFCVKVVNLQMNNASIAKLDFFLRSGIIAYSVLI